MGLVSKYKKLKKSFKYIHDDLPREIEELKTNNSNFSSRLNEIENTTAHIINLNDENKHKVDNLDFSHKSE